MLNLDKTKCTQCGQCTRVCPFTVLEKIGDYPVLNEKKLCLECYHCTAICPVGALSFGDRTILPIKEISSGKPQECNELLKELVKKRRSIRKYKDTPVSKEVMTEVLDTVKMTPTAKNQMKNKWIVVSGKEKVNQVFDLILKYVKESGTSKEILKENSIGNNVVTMKAPTLLLVYANKNIIAPEIDCMIALTTAELLLQAHGIGSCHAGYLRRLSNASQEIKDFFGLSDDEQFYGALTLGYADNEEYLSIPKRNEPDVKWL